MMRKKRKLKWRMIVLYMVMLAVAVIQIYPLFWVITSSMKTSSEIKETAYLLPSGLYFDHYFRALQTRLPRYFLNSTIVAFGVLVSLILLSAPAGYALSKMRFRYAEQMTTFFLFGIMIPTFVCLIPMFRMYSRLGIDDTFLALVIPQVGFSLPLSIFLYRNFMDRIPDSLTDAAAIDGASHWYCFLRIVFPMSKNITATILTYNFISVWNEFTYASIFIHTMEKKTLPIGLNGFVGEMGNVDWGITYAGITLTILPTLFVYLFLNKQVIEGMTAGALKT